MSLSSSAEMVVLSVVSAMLCDAGVFEGYDDG